MLLDFAISQVLNFNVVETRHSKMSAFIKHSIMRSIPKGVVNASVLCLWALQKPLGILNSRHIVQSGCKWCILAKYVFTKAYLLFEFCFMYFLAYRDINMFSYDFKSNLQNRGWLYKEHPILRIHHICLESMNKICSLKITLEMGSVSGEKIP